MNVETLVWLLVALLVLRVAGGLLRFVWDAVTFTWHQRRTHALRRRLVWRR